MKRRMTILAALLIAVLPLLMGQAGQQRPGIRIVDKLGTMIQGLKRVLATEAVVVVPAVQPLSLTNDGYRTAGFRLGGNNWPWHTDGQVAKWAQHDIVINDLYQWCAADSFSGVVPELVAANPNIIVLGFIDGFVYNRYDSRADTNTAAYNPMQAALHNLFMKYPALRADTGDTAEYGDAAAATNQILCCNVDTIVDGQYIWEAAADTVEYYWNLSDNTATGRLGIYIDVLENSIGSSRTDLDWDDTLTLDPDVTEQLAISRARENFVNELRDRLGANLIVGGQTYHAIERTARSDSLLAVLDFVMLEDFRCTRTEWGTRRLFGFFEPTADKYYRNIVDGMRQTRIDPLILFENDYEPKVIEAVAQIDTQLYVIWPSLNRDKESRDYSYPADVNYVDFDLGAPVGALTRTAEGRRVYQEYQNGSVLLHVKTGVTTSSNGLTEMANWWIGVGTDDLAVTDYDTAWTDTLKGSLLVRSNAWPDSLVYVCTNDTTARTWNSVWPLAPSRDAWIDSCQWSMVRGDSAATDNRGAHLSDAANMSIGTYVPGEYQNKNFSGYRHIWLYYGVGAVPGGTDIKSAYLSLKTLYTNGTISMTADTNWTLYAHLNYQAPDTAWWHSHYTGGSNPNEADCTWLEYDDGAAGNWNPTLSTRDQPPERGIASGEFRGARTGHNLEWFNFPSTRAVQSVVDGTPDGGWHITYRRPSGDGNYYFTNPDCSADSAYGRPFVRVAVGCQDFEIVASASENGSISPSGTTTYHTFGVALSDTFTITPDAGYVLSELLVDGENVELAGAYVFTDITSDHVINATFAFDGFNIEAAAEPHGSITPSGSVSVATGADTTFTIDPDNGYVILDVEVDSESVIPDTASYTFTNVQASHAIKAYFTTEAQPESVAIYATSSNVSYGTISVNSPWAIDENDSVFCQIYDDPTFTITPAGGYDIDEVVVGGISQGAVSQYQFIDIAEDDSIRATFVAETPPPPGTPDITNVSGTWTRGNTIAITGTDFGAGPTVFSYDDFEDGTLTNTIRSEMPVVGAWAWSCPWWHYGSDTDHDIIYDDEHALVSQAARVWWKSYSINAFGWAGRGPFRTIYYTFYRYHDPKNGDLSPDNDVPTNHKLIYTYGNDTAEQQQQMLGAIMAGARLNWQTAWQASPSPTWYTSPLVSYANSTRQWNRFEQFFEMSTGSGATDGTIEFRIDCSNKIRAENVNVNNLTTAAYLDDWRCGYMYQGYKADGFSQSWFDDVYVANSMARVEIGDNEVFESCTERSILVPTAWTGTSISATYYSPGVIAGNNVYVFVVAEDGTPSGGYAVDMSAGGTTPPVLSAAAIASFDTTTVAGYVTLNVEATADSSVAIRCGWKAFYDGTFNDRAWTPEQDTTPTDTLRTGISTATASGDTFFVRIKAHADVAADSTAWYTVGSFGTLKAVFVRASPPAENVSGTIAEDSTVTISVGSYGAKGAAAPLWYDTIDNIATYGDDETITHRNLIVPVGTGEKYSAQTGSVRFFLNASEPDSVRQTAGAHDYYVAWRTGYLTASEAWFGAPNDESKSIYYSWWMWTNHVLSTGGNSNDMLQASCTSTIGDGPVYKRQSTNASTFYSGSCGAAASCGTSTEMAAGAWTHYEVSITGDGETSDGGTIVHWLQDGRRCATSDSVCFSATGGMVDRIQRLGSSPSNAAAYPTDSIILFGEIYADSSLARVIISDSDAYSWPASASARNWEIQPCTAWSNDEITFTVNQGQFANSTTVYIYVIKQGGTVMTPIEVVVGTTY